MKESDFMTIYNYDKHQDYKFEYKKDHILVDKFYNTTNKYATMAIKIQICAVVIPFSFSYVIQS